MLKGADEMWKKYIRNVKKKDIFNCNAEPPKAIIFLW